MCLDPLRENPPPPSLSLSRGGGGGCPQLPYPPPHTHTHTKPIAQTYCSLFLPVFNTLSITTDVSLSSTPHVVACVDYEDWETTAGLSCSQIGSFGNVCDEVPPHSTRSYACLPTCPPYTHVCVITCRSCVK